MITKTYQVLKTLQVGKIAILVSLFALSKVSTCRQTGIIYSFKIGIVEELTKKEEEIMLLFWQLEKAFVKDVIAELPQDPKPPYNTISSIVRILERKGYLGFKKYGNTYQYYPIIEKTAYRKGFMKKVMKGYFDNSPASLLSFMVNEEKLSPEEMEQLKKIIEKF